MDYQAAATIIDRNSGLYDITTNEAENADACFSPHRAIYASSLHAHADAATSYRSQP